MSRHSPGDFVKVEFRDKTTGAGEWMWIRVDPGDDEKGRERESANGRARRESTTTECVTLKFAWGRQSAIVTKLSLKPAKNGQKRRT